MLKKIQVVMLPANEKASKLVLMNDRELELVKNGNEFRWGHQHLYFLSDEEIKEGDWFIRDLTYVEKADSNTHNMRNEKKKIIATTDESLTFKNHPKGVSMYLLPKPSQSFLEVFVREYNKGNIIKEVLVEYEEKETTEQMSGVEFYGTSEVIVDYEDILKINPKDNTITIKRVKDSWSREDLSIF